MSEIKNMHVTPGMRVDALVRQLRDSGFQAQNVGIAAEILRAARRQHAKLFLSFTSNMAASGLRGILIDLIQQKKVDVIITTSGSFDEDLIRSSMPYLQGSFEADDEKLGAEGINRMGNILVPNDRYAFLDDEMRRVLDALYTKKKAWTVSELLAAVGEEWRHADSFVVQAARHGVPIFCPGITDGSFGMQLAFFRQQHPDFTVDTLADFTRLINIASAADITAGIILGGGISKHHTIISNLIGGGFDYAIYVNSSTPYHGSLSNATTSEAKSWGKIKAGAKAVTVHGDASLVFPLIIAAAEGA